MNAISNNSKEPNNYAKIQIDDPIDMEKRSSAIVRLTPLLFLSKTTSRRISQSNSLLSVADNILLRKRALIETVNNELKNIAQIEHSRHRSFNNFITNALSAIPAYCFFKKKPAIDVSLIKDRQLTLF